MRITNRRSLPELIVRAIENDPYSRGDSDVTVTQLVKPPRIVALEKLHADEIEVDASDMVWALFGQTVHIVLERAASRHPAAIYIHHLIDWLEGIAVGENEFYASAARKAIAMLKRIKTKFARRDDSYIIERRFSANILGWGVSGQADVIHVPTGTLQDYKVTSVWSVVNAFKDGKSEWEQQLNMLAYLAGLNDVPVKRVQIVAIMRDWQETRARFDNDYPQSAIQTVTFPLWRPEQQQAFIERRIREHQEAQQAVDEAAEAGGTQFIPYCTPEEMWEKPAMWAVMTKGRKSAHRLLYSVEDAERWAEENLHGKNWYIEKRPAERRRCERYCRVRDFCEVWDAWKRDMEVEGRRA